MVLATLRLEGKSGLVSPPAPVSERALCQRRPVGKGLGSQPGWHLARPSWNHIRFLSFANALFKMEIVFLLQNFSCSISIMISLCLLFFFFLFIVHKHFLPLFLFSNRTLPVYNKRTNEPVWPSLSPHELAGYSRDSIEGAKANSCHALRALRAAWQSCQASPSPCAYLPWLPISCFTEYEHLSLLHAPASPVHRP